MPVSSDDKGKFDAAISPKAIEEALDAVRKRSGAEVPVEPADAPPASVEAAPATPKEVEDLRAQLEFSQAKGREMMEKIKDAHEKMLRSLADLENFKKRAQKEKEEIQRFGSEKLLKAFLPIADNLDRALEHAKGPADLDSVKEGLMMTRKLFEDTLSKHGVRPFSAIGKPFDPRFHEAMQQVESTELPPNQVMSEMVRGYMLNDRLVRPALVSVSKAPSPVEQVPPAGPPSSEASASASALAPEGAATGEKA